MPFSGEGVGDSELISQIAAYLFLGAGGNLDGAARTLSAEGQEGRFIEEGCQCLTPSCRRLSRASTP